MQSSSSFQPLRCCVRYTSTEYYSGYLIRFRPYQRRRFCLSSALRGQPANHYEVLGLRRGASAADIKGAFYRLSKQYHPDKSVSPQSKAMFLKVNDAYQVLGGAGSKAEYDRTLPLNHDFVSRPPPHVMRRSATKPREKNPFDDEDWIPNYFEDGTFYNPKHHPYAENTFRPSKSIIVLLILGYMVGGSLGLAFLFRAYYQNQRSYLDEQDKTASEAYMEAKLRSRDYNRPLAILKGQTGSRVYGHTQGSPDE